MTAPITPGQVAYEAYCAAFRPSVLRSVTALFRPPCGAEEHRAWEAAAQAVLAEGISRARAVVRHWNDAGPGDGFMELMDHMAAWLDTQEEATP